MADRWSSDLEAAQRPLVWKFLYSGEVIPYPGMFEEGAPPRLSLGALLSGSAGEKGANLPPRDIISRPLDNKFGTWDGVFARCLVNILGVIFFLRLDWVIGRAGVGLGLMAIFLSLLTTFITGASLSAISTNGKLQRGGAYFLLSRSMGPEFAGPIGIIFAFANAVTVSLCVVACTETMVVLTGPVLTGDILWDIRIWGTCLLLVMLVLVLTSIKWVVKVALLFLLLTVVGLIWLGSFRSPPSGVTSGFVGWGSGALRENWNPQFAGGENFFYVLGVFYPAVTGIMAGVNISGELKDAQSSIPKGTLWATGISGTLYILSGFMIGAVCTRDSLIQHELVMRQVSIIGFVVVLGILAGGISSALIAFDSAPRIFEAVCADKLFPYIEWFAKRREGETEPRKSYVLIFIVALCGVMIGDLNSIATLITNFLLITYGMVNYAVFETALADSPGWRPSWRYYHPYLALFGAACCFLIMILINWLAAFSTIVLCYVIYKYIQRFGPDVNWGSADHARAGHMAIDAMKKLDTAKEHVKLYRPNCLVMAGGANRRDALISFASCLLSGHGILLCGNVLVGPRTPEVVRGILADRAVQRCPRDGGFPCTTVAPSLRLGVQTLLETGGLGRLRPNFLLLGYKSDWGLCASDLVSEYVGTIHDAFEVDVAVGVLRGSKRIGNAPHSGPIHVYWLSDDGGLTLLAAYLLMQHQLWKSCHLVVYSPIPTEMEEMLRQFRIPGEAALLDDISAAPSEAAVREYESLHGPPVSQQTQEERCHTLQAIRIGEIIRGSSGKKADLVVCTLPLPNINTNPLLYMARLEIMSHDTGPVLFARGNQKSVLTSYA